MSFLCAGVCGLLSLSADAGTVQREVTHNVPFSIEPDGLGHLISVEQFDDVGGTRQLINVSFAAGTQISVSVQAENDSSQEVQEFDLLVFGSLNASFGPLTIPPCILQQSFPCPNPPVAASDGVPGTGPDVCDYGLVESTTSACGAVESAGGPTDTSAFIGQGTISATLSTVGGFNVQSPNNVTFTFQDFASTGMLTVVYSYLVDLGGCCFADGACADLTEPECTAGGGAWNGLASECATDYCLGTCCLPDGFCFESTVNSCAGALGLYGGYLTTCATDGCPGACCLNDGACAAVHDVLACDALGGAYQGLGTSCDTTSCPGACCILDGSCTTTDDAPSCALLGGIYQGFGSNCAGVFCPLPPPVTPLVRGCGNEKGSLVVFSAVELRWNAAGALIQDTFLTLLNDWPEDVRVQMYFINGDAPLPMVGAERAHPGWNHVSTEITLTKNEPAYWSALNGEPKGLPPLAILDPGLPRGRPAADGTTDRVLRGYALAWAVNADNHEIRWNHLAGSALTINYDTGYAHEYEACTFPVLTGVITGAQTGLDPGVLNLDGVEYAACPGQLMMSFFTANVAIPGVNSIMTDLTLHVADVDLRQEDEGPVTTKAVFDIWNQNEVKFNGTEKCITCWDQTLLGDYLGFGLPNNFLTSALQTDAAKARIDGLRSDNCDVDFEFDPNVPFGDDPRDVVSRDAALIGLTARHILVTGAGSAGSARTLTGMGLESAVIRYDPAGGGLELVGTTVRRSGR